MDPRRWKNPATPARSSAAPELLTLPGSTPSRYEAIPRFLLVLLVPFLGRPNSPSVVPLCSASHSHRTRTPVRRWWQTAAPLRLPYLRSDPPGTDSCLGNPALSHCHEVPDEKASHATSHDRP